MIRTVLHGKPPPRQIINNKLLAISEEVRSAVFERRPVVALESTIYTHGFPFPDNVGLASDLESVVRSNGGIPATIGVLHGQARVGLSPNEITELASAAGKEGTMKVSRRDLPFITGLGLSGRRMHGGTTVSGTMVLARKAGIRVFGTGGLGGVHRGGQDTMDISADLTELGRTAVAVISSGCKSFLDIPRTLEYLETQGVCVSTFADGRTGSIDLPAFWTRDSGVKSPSVVNNEAEAAAIIFAQRTLQINSGLLFANPIPEEFSIPLAEMNVAIDEAIREAAEKGYTGHTNTPFILAKIKELTGGKSLPANRALIESNVARATRVAVELAKLDIENEETRTTYMPAPVNIYPQSTVPEKADIIVLGSIAIDLTCDHAPLVSHSVTPELATSNPAAIRQSIGGVGHNVAAAAHMIGSKHVKLCSLIGSDLAGETILASLNSRGLDTTGIQVSKRDGSRTAQYVAVNDKKKDLVVAMADMSILDDATELQKNLEGTNPSCLVVDANWSAPSIRQFFTVGKATNAQTVFEPVSTAKSTRLFPIGKTLPTFPNHIVDLAAPNNYELAAMYMEARSNGYLETKEWFQVVDAMGIPSSGARDRFVALTDRDMVDQGIPQQTIQLLPFMPIILTKLGKDGVLLTALLTPEDERLTDPEHAKWILSRHSGGGEVVGGVYMRLFPAKEILENIVSVNGVGDTFLGAIVAGIAEGKRLDKGLIDVAQRAAAMTLMSKEAVGDIGELKEELKALQ